MEKLNIPEEIVISLGGNALTLGREGITVEDQHKACEIACKIIAKVFARDNVKMALCHGNGPQVGFISDRFACAEQHGILHHVKLDAIGADTQGAIGYMIEQELYSELHKLDPLKAAHIATLVTQVLVDPEDEAFDSPTKPIGVWMTEDEAQKKMEEDSDLHIELLDQSREDGWRQVVPSPKPMHLLNAKAIRHNVNGGLLTIAGGGGGIPIVRNPDDGKLKGIEGVIDKDRTSALIAKIVRARMLVIFTEAPGVIDPEEFRRKDIDGEVIAQLTTAEAKDMISQLPTGSMGPKLEACADFTEETGEPSIIANFGNAEDAIVDKGGTRIVAQ